MEKEGQNLGLSLVFLLFSFSTNALVILAVCVTGMHELWAFCHIAWSEEFGKLFVLPLKRVICVSSGLHAEIHLLYERS